MARKQQTTAVAMPRMTLRACRTLTVKDHTLIMEALFRNILQVLILIDGRRYSQTNTRPSATRVLKAMLQLATVDRRIKKRISLVLLVLPFVTKAQRGINKDDRGAVDRIVTEVNATRTGELFTKLKRLRKEAQASESSGVVMVLDQVAAILKDGQRTIYSPKWLGGGVVMENAAGDIGRADVAYGVAGGVAGIPFGPGVAAGGAVGGAVGGSAGTAVAMLIDWLWP